MSEPFDQALYDRAMDAFNTPKNDVPVRGRPSYLDGYREGVTVAARIAAERVAVSDAEPDRLVDLIAEDLGRYLGDGASAHGDESEHMARLIRSALGPQVPVSDEELAKAYDKAFREHVHEIPDNLLGSMQAEEDMHMAGIRAVRAAIGPTVPVIPDGWDWYDMRTTPDGEKRVRLLCDQVGVPDAIGKGATWHDALTAAIEAAQGVEP